MIRCTPVLGAPTTADLPDVSYRLEVGLPGFLARRMTGSLVELVSAAATFLEDETPTEGALATAAFDDRFEQLRFEMGAGADITSGRAEDLATTSRVLAELGKGPVLMDKPTALALARAGTVVRHLLADPEFAPALPTRPRETLFDLTGFLVEAISTGV